MISFGAEDRKRADMYRANAQRASSLQSLGDYDTYLTGLDMTMTLSPFDEIGLKRIAQLIGKTNQFNLTTRRYNEQEVREFEPFPGHWTLQVRLADRFGDNGMIAVAICEKGDVEWRIDSWLMSCRVLKRRVEEAMLAEIAARARAEGATLLIGEYMPTARNGLVADHYRKLGFARTDQRTDGSQVWVLDLPAYTAPELPFRFAQPLPEQSAANQAAE